MLVGFAEGLGAAKTYAAREHYEIDTNRELLGLGGANLAAGLSSGMVVNGSLSKTAVNGSAGANTQLSSLLVAGLTIVTLLFLTGLFEQLPEATLAAAAMLGVLVFDTLPGLFLGISVSLLLLLSATSSPTPPATRTTARRGRRRTPRGEWALLRECRRRARPRAGRGGRGRRGRR